MWTSAGEIPLVVHMWIVVWNGFYMSYAIKVHDCSKFVTGKITLLSETMTSGMPCVSSIPLSFSMVIEDVAENTMVISSHLE